MIHLVIRDPELNGWEYGMLRSFESAIVKETGADLFELPSYRIDSSYFQNFRHGMNRGIYRKFFPKQELRVVSDVAWCILMGPENYRLDMYKNWEIGCKTKILYLFDTLPSQYPLIKRLFSNNTWDILITSFNDAVDDLEKITGRKWYCIEQAADSDIFKPVPFRDRLVHFSSYGRRVPLVHKALLDFCDANDLYYDYTTHDTKHPVVDATELYRQYAWHLTHSIFTFSWPVELTNPKRAGHLNPITCRWFEGAAAGTVLLGMQPDNVKFNQWIGEGMVINIDPSADISKIYNKLDFIWANREQLSEFVLQVKREKSNFWIWNERVRRILSLIVAT